MPWATQTDPAPTSMPLGVRPSSGKVPAGERLAASIFVSVRSSRFPTHTAPPPAATGPGPEADLDLFDDLVRLRIDDSDVVRLDAAQPALRIARGQEQGRGDHGEDHEGGRRQHGPAAPERWRRGRLERFRRRCLAARRREIRREARRGDLVEANGALDVLEPLVAQIAHPDGEVFLLVLEQVLRRLGDEHLAAVTRGADACGAMDGEARIAAVDRHRLARVDPDPDLDLGLVRPGIATTAPAAPRRPRAPLRRRFRTRRRTRPPACRSRARRAGRRPYGAAADARRAPPRTGAQLLDQLRRPLDVREDEGHRAAGEI